jgi:hypothetical protein
VWHLLVANPAWCSLTATMAISGWGVFLIILFIVVIGGGAGYIL